jgi:pimeloyl-ACP methyl ester carboxylesterase
MQFALFAVAFAAAIYAALCVLLYVGQDSFIFFPVTNNKALAENWRAHRIEIQADNTTIEGWWVENTQTANNITVLYFAGNAEDVLNTAESANRYNAKRVLVSNYRGYGATPGKPSEQALFEDALAIYDYVIKQPGVSADSIVVMGRSLGSGVATYVAAHRAVRGVVLVTPYENLAAVAQEQFPYFPVRLLLKHKFPSDQLAIKISAPALLMAGEHDAVIPSAHAQKLAAAWAGPKTLDILKGAGHNDIELHAQYYPLISAFLEHLAVR